MANDKEIDILVSQWINIAERDLLAAQQSLQAAQILTEVVCFQCQQAAEKFLKAFLLKNQLEFPKTHSIRTLLNLCSKKDLSFNRDLSEADNLTDYAVELRYPDDWYEPKLDEAQKAYETAVMVREFVLNKLKKF
jgi:HEPN domain-containing protein